MERHVTDASVRSAVRHRWQFSIKALLLFVAEVCGCLATFKYHSARQARGIRALKKLEADYELEGEHATLQLKLSTGYEREEERATLLGRAWINLVGGRVATVDLSQTQAIDDDLHELAYLAPLRSLVVYGAKITECGLRTYPKLEDASRRHVSATLETMWCFDLQARPLSYAAGLISQLGLIDVRTDESEATAIAITFSNKVELKLKEALDRMLHPRGLQWKMTPTGVLISGTAPPPTASLGTPGK